MRNLRSHCLILVAIFVIPSVVFGSVLTESESSTMDSLLLVADLNNARELLDNAVSRSQGDSVLPDDVEEFQYIGTSFADLMEYIEVLPSSEPQTLVNLVRQGQSQKDQYRELYAGITASTAYEKFVDMAESTETLEGLMYLRIAYHCKNIYLRSVARKARVNTVAARELYRAGDVAAAHTLLSEAAFDPGHNVDLRVVHDSLTALNEKVEKELGRQRFQEEMWESKEGTLRRFAVFIGGDMISRPNCEEVPFDIIEGNQSGLLTIEEIPVDAVPSFAGDIQYSVGSNLLIGAGFTSAKYTYKGSEATEPAYFDFSTKTYSVYGVVRYLLRKYVGFRPYLGLGGGMAHYSQEATSVSVLRPQHDPDAGLVFNTYDMESRSFSSMQVLTELGVQYVPGQNSGLIADVRLSYRHNSKNDALVGRRQVAIGMRVGIAL